MAKRTGYVRNIFFSIIISLLVLLSLGFLSIKYLVPIYDLQSQDIYRFLIYLLPVLIGLVLIEIGSIISSRHEQLKEEDSEDLLPKNSYDAPLFTTINDDPSEKYSENEFIPIGANINSNYSLNDYLDRDIYQRVKKYKREELIKIFNNYENGSKNLNSPFDEELTNNLFALSSDEAIKAYQWIKDGASIEDENLTIFNNLDKETITLISKLSQREATKALDWLNNSDKYYNLENLSENNILGISHQNDEDITRALNWINLGCPSPADPNAYVFDNLDKDTISRLLEYNSIQVNVGLDYIDEGAPDVVSQATMSIGNLSQSTINRLSNIEDNSVNRALDILDNDFINRLDFVTIDRLNSYNNEQINEALDFIDNGQQATMVEDLPFGDEINNKIRSLSPTQALDAINYINNTSDETDLGDLSNNLEDFLNSELSDNGIGGFNFNITLVIFDKNNIINEDNKALILSKLPSYTYLFKTNRGHTAIIFPYEGKSNAKQHLDDILNETSIIDPSFVSVGYSSQDNRDIDASTLINEAYLN